MFDFLKKLSFISRIQKAIKEVKEVLNKPHTIEVENKIIGGVNKISEGMNDIKEEVPAVSGIVNDLQKALRDTRDEDKQD